MAKIECAICGRQIYKPRECFTFARLDSRTIVTICKFCGFSILEDYVSRLDTEGSEENEV